MASAREIQNRIKSIQETMKITNAMFMISSSKLRKAKQKLEETRPYFIPFRLQSAGFFAMCRISTMPFSTNGRM